MVSRVPQEERDENEETKKIKIRKESQQAYQAVSSPVQNSSFPHRRGHAPFRRRRASDKGGFRQGVRTEGTSDDLGAAGEGGSRCEALSGGAQSEVLE